ncbi:hypothetical protein P9112_014178 [Eukaryota sp. TZLM1-RC]
MYSLFSTSGTPKVRCFAVLSKVGTPLYISVPPTDEHIVFHFMTHCSLDYFEEKLNSIDSTRHPCYLDLLYPSEAHRTYGFITPTGTKFVVIIDDIDITKSAMERFFSSAYEAYLKVVLNPFYEDLKPIKSNLFESNILTAITLLEGELKSILNK